MSAFYFSGIDRASWIYLLRQDHAAGMINFLDWSRRIEWALDDTQLQFAVDSGAYSKILTTQDIQQYAVLIERLGDRADFYAAPDFIGDQEASNRNYEYLLSLLPIWLHHHVLWIYQYGTDIRYLYEGLEQHTCIGIGGLVPLLQADPRKAEDVILSLAEIIKKAGVIPHFFGIGMPTLIQGLKGIHEDFSIDASTWLVGAKYGAAIDETGQRHLVNVGGFDWDKESILRQNVRTMQKWVRGRGTSKKSSYSQQGLWEEIA